MMQRNHLKQFGFTGKRRQAAVRIEAPEPATAAKVCRTSIRLLEFAYGTIDAS